MLAWYFILLISLVAAGVAGFLIYWFAFRKTKSGNDNGGGGTVDPNALEFKEILQIPTTPLGVVSSLGFSNVTKNGFLTLEQVGGYPFVVSRNGIAFGNGVAGAVDAFTGDTFQAVNTNNNTLVSIGTWNGTSYATSASLYNVTAIAIAESKSTKYLGVRNYTDFRIFSVLSSSDGTTWTYVSQNVTHPQMSYVLAGFFFNGNILHVIDATFQIFKVEGVTVTYVASVWNNVSQNPLSDNAVKCSFDAVNGILYLFMRRLNGTLIENRFGSFSLGDKAWTTDLKGSNTLSGNVSFGADLVAFSLGSSSSVVYKASADGTLTVTSAGHLVGNPAQFPNNLSHAVWVGHFDSDTFLLTGGSATKFNVGMYERVK